MPDDALVLILDLHDDKFEGEEMIGLMMGGLTGPIGLGAAREKMLDAFGSKTDDEIPF